MNIIGQNGNDGIHYDLEEEKPKVKIIEKIIEDPRMNHPRIQEAIKHAKRVGLVIYVYITQIQMLWQIKQN